MTKDEEWILKYIKDCLFYKQEVTCIVRRGAKQELVKCDERAKNIYSLFKGNCDSVVDFKVVECNKDELSRAYYQRKGNVKNIVICNNVVKDLVNLNEVIRHELIHSIDDNSKCSGWKCNYSNIDDRSCSEIRAAFWGECNNLLDKHHNGTSAHKECVKQTALESVRLHFQPEELCKESVERMLKTCYNNQIIRNQILD
ncbi:hypothetical protein ABK040_002106 [Willaertia magna]